MYYKEGNSVCTAEKEIVKRETDKEGKTAATITSQ
jgi:hypothetical protein